MKTIITWLKRAAMLSVMVAFAAAGLGANAATSLTLNDGDTLTGVYEGYEITIAAGATVTFNGATITRSSGGAPAVNCLGDATIILAPGSVNAVTNTVGGYSCVRPAENATLTIRGSGTLTAAGGYNAAAIGSGSGQNGTCGSIVIKGGTIEAFGGTTGAGIGSGNSGTCGSIVIEGGTVTAQGGDWSAGIGSAYNGTCGDITISGGTVTAEVDRSTSDNMTCTAAIGAGCRGTCGNILISGGTVVADAHSGYSRDDACAIGATYTNGKCGDITLTTGITSLTATKGATAQQYIGQGDGSATVGRIYGMLRFDKEYSNDGNTVTLTPKASFESYTVTWKNDDGTTADTTSVEYGLLPSHAGLTKAGDGYLEYLFAGWTPEFAEVESNVAYTAVFIAVPAVRSTGGDAEWFVDADEGALRSGVIGDNQNTWLRTSLPRPCVFSFKWKTSSETGCDNLHFTVNGAYVLDTEGKQVATISGVGNDWTTVSVVISNSLDVLEWKYGKDGSAVSGQDCGWVKDFEMATFDGEIRSLSVVPNYDGLATVTAYAAKDVVMDVFPPLARHGYALLGYFTAAEGGELVEPPYALSADTTLYAHWAKTTDFDTSDPTAEWTIEDDGITWRTGAIGHSTNTWATYTVKRPCTVTYKWKTSTEANNDPLVFYVDDVEQSRISGESADWVDVSLSFEDSKNHVLKWVYSKDWSDTGRYDCGWIRDFVVTPYDSWAVTRELNYEGAAEIETRYVKKGSQLDVSEFPPSDEPREGYSCSWAMAPWSGDALSAPVDISADTTLYAHWIKQYGFDEIDTTCQEPWTWLDDGSIRTGKIGDSGETWVTISVTGPCDVSFKWMTSSESGWDKLHFYVDDSHKIEISGVTPEWESYTASVGSGDHVLKWTYTKDGGGAFGEDCGWVKDIVITAPDSAPYTVTWKNADGTTLETDADLEAGAVPVYNSALPTLAATAQYTYEFAGWEPEFELVSSNTTYTAKYTATLRSYDVTWQNEDGTPLGATNIFYGATPTYSGATPVKPATPKFTYTFAGWDPEVAAVTGEATYTATYDATINEYTITWKNDDGTVIDSADVAYDETPSHAAPTKASTAQYHYEFAGWSPAIASVTGEATYTATFTPILRSYTITWLNEDGTALDTSTVEYGATPSHAAPTKASTAKYDYTFAGWGNVVAVSGEATYQATFTPVLRSYTITWANIDGAGAVATSTVAYGSIPAYGGVTPTKAETAEYSYEFAGWSPAVSAVTGEATYTAQFNATKRSYTITWLNEGGAVLASGDVEYGTVPAYGGATPTKAETAEYTYTFSGWSPTVSTVTDEATYTAQFNATKRSYMVSWVVEGATVASGTVEYGTTPIYDGDTPTKESTAEYSYTFTGWSPTVSTVTGEATYTAQFNATKRSYTITWANIDGEGASATSTVEHGTTPTYGGETPTKAADAQYTYTFAGWTPAVAAVTGDTVYTATFTPVTRSYTVTWVVEGETVASGAVEYGQTPTYDGDTPTKAADAQYTYEFAGWTPAVAAVTGDATYTAQFNATPKDIPVENVLFSEDFDTASLAPGLTMTVVGSFKSYPGIKAGLGTDDSGAFSFGRSTCGSSAFDNYMTTLTLDFGKETYVTRIEFDEMERYGDWGSQGRILVDGTVVDGLTFTKPGSAGYGNSRVADSEFRHKTLTLERSLTTIALQVYDITTESEEFIDNLCVYGYGDGTVTVTWRNEDGTILEADKNVALGTMPTYDGATPTKAADAQYTYEFAGWEPAVAAVAGDATYTAQFNATKRSYTVSWVVEGVTVASGTVEYGATPVYGGDTPTKAETAEYSYEFTGWTPVVAAVTGDATYTAQFNSTKRSYTVSWVVEGATVASGTVEYGQTPSYGGETPTKESTAQYDYEFTGWGDVVAVTGDATYTAVFTPVTRSYNVTWVVDGMTVASGTVEYGTTPVYNGATPTKPEDENYTYTFNGWTPAVVAVIGNATYTATFTATPKETEDPDEPYEGTETIDGIAWSYTVANGEATITGAQFAEGAIAIPETVHDGVPVMAIEEGVFADNQDITEVTISRYVRRIGADVGVKSADWAQNLEEAGFDGSYPAFGNCESLLNYRVDVSNEVFEEIGGALYYRDTPANAKELALYPSGRDTLYFANGLTVTKIGDGACAWCHKFTELTIPASVREIGVRSFDFCREIVTLTIPATVTDIGWGAFLMNIALVNADINGTDLAIGDYAFYHSFMADNAGNLVIRGGVKDVGFNAFCHSMHLGAVVMEDGVTNIAMNAFSQCDYLSTVTLPDTLTAIGAGAFCGCCELRELIVPLSVDEIGLSQPDDGSDGGAFAGCSALVRIYLPLSLKPATVEETNAYLANVFEGLSLEDMSAAEIAEILTWYSDPSEIEGEHEPQELPDYVSTGGSAEWFVEGNDGVEPGAWRSGAIGDSQNTWIETTVTGPCLVSFQWRVSSEEGYDNLHLTVDGEERDPISGSADWDNVSLTFRDAGSHTIRWTYLKDSSASNGEDCGWVKGLTETPKTFTSYTVTWKNWDGTVLDTDSVLEDDMPEYTAATPTRPKDDEYTYVFNGWSPDIVAATGNVEYTATYTALPNLPASVSSGGDAEWFVDTDGSWRSGTIMNSQETWIETTVTGPCLVTFSWKASSEGGGYDMLALAVDGEEKDSIGGVMSDWVEYSLPIPESGAHTVRWKYFKDSSAWEGEDCGWVKDFTETPKTFTSYTVTWKNWDGTVLGEDSVVEGFMPQYRGETPARATDEDYYYTFAGWTPDIVAADADTIYMATYNEYQARFEMIMDGTTVTGYKGLVQKHITLADWPEGVTAIDDDVFSGYSALGFYGLESIEIPATVETIGERAFYCAYGLTNLVFEAGGSQPLSIGFAAFDFAYALESVTFPARLASIGSSAFNQNTSLETVTFLGNQENVEIDDDAFKGTPYYAKLPFKMRLMEIDGQQKVVSYQGTLPEVISLADWPAEATAIAGGSLGWNSIVKDITIPSTITSVDAQAFYSSYELTNVVFAVAAPGEDPVPLAIEESAFGECGKLRSVTLRDGLARIAGYAFSGCPLLAEVNFPPSGTDGAYIADSAFAGTEYESHLPFKFYVDESNIVTGFRGECPANIGGEGGVPWPDNISGIGSDAFSGCTTLEHVTFPAGIEAVALGAFRGCGNLASVNFANCFATLTAIGGESFSGCTSLETVELDGDGLYIDSSAFESCTSLTTLTLGSGVSKVDEFAFAYSTSLAAFVNNSSAVIDETAFLGTAYNKNQPFSFITKRQWGELVLAGYRGECPAQITADMWPAGVTYVNRKSFTFCDTLRAIEFPANIGYIDESAFACCTNLASITFPEEGSLHVGHNAFALCTKLQNVTLQSGMEVENDAFGGCASLETVIVEKGVRTIGPGAFARTLVRSIVLPEGIHWVDNMSFVGNDGDFTLYIPRNADDGNYGVSDGTVEYEYYPLIFGLETEAGWARYGFVKRATTTDLHVIPYCRVTLDLAGGSGVATSLLGTGETVNDQFAHPVKSGFTFAGWTSTRVAAIAADTTWTAIIGSATGMEATLTALWTPNETPEPPEIVVEDQELQDKLDDPVVDEDTGIRTIKPKDDQTTLTQDDADKIDIKSPLDGTTSIKGAYTMRCDPRLNQIVITLAVPEVESVAEEENKEAEDATGLLEDVAKVDDEKIAAMPEPDVSDPEPEKREEVGALPIKMYPGLYYQASWGDDLNNLTSGAKFRADGSQTHIGVIKQTGSRGFYKISVSER